MNIYRIFILLVLLLINGCATSSNANIDKDILGTYYVSNIDKGMYRIVDVQQNNNKTILIGENVITKQSTEIDYDDLLQNYSLVHKEDAENLITKAILIASIIDGYPSNEIIHITHRYAQKFEERQIFDESLLNMDETGKTFFTAYLNYYENPNIFNSVGKNFILDEKYHETLKKEFRDIRAKKYVLYKIERLNAYTSKIAPEGEFSKYNNTTKSFNIRSFYFLYLGSVKNKYGSPIDYYYNIHIEKPIVFKVPETDVTQFQSYIPDQKFEHFYVLFQVNGTRTIKISGELIKQINLIPLRYLMIQQRSSEEVVFKNY